MSPDAAGAAADRLAVAVRSEYDVATVIAAVTRFCERHRFGAVFAAHVATAASELANNLWLYALRGGEVRLALVETPARTGVELVAQDDGPGIADIGLALTEGYSSSGGMGCGLPGVKRLMDEFEIESNPGAGTRVRARKWAHRVP